LDISCRVVFSSHKWNKKEGSPSSFWRKRQFISLNSSVFIENLPSFERARARARANHAKIDAQKGCAMQLNVITLNGVGKSEIWVLNRVRVWAPRPHHPIWPTWASTKYSPPGTRYGHMLPQTVFRFISFSK